MSLTLHSDEPTTEEKLGRQALVDEIAAVAATAAPPLVLGVHGDWGSGKTSFMLRAQEALENGKYKDGIVTVRFEAWRYQNEPAPVVALLQEMRRRFSLFTKARSQAAKLSEVAFRGVLGGLDQAAKLVGIESQPFSPDKYQALGEQWEKERLAMDLASDTLRDYLEQAIGTLLPNAGKNKPQPRVVVFIDDLDRCNSAMAYRLLEGLKIYLNLRNCVFMLAMNQQVITDAIAENLKKDEHDAGVKLRAEAYLEKLCANIWRLPPPPVPQGFLADLLDDEAAKTAIITAATATRPGFLPPNPRRLKALANLYNRLWPRASRLAAAGPEREMLPLRVLVVAYVYQFHSEFFQRWRHDPSFLEELRTWMETGRPKLVMNQDGKDVPDPGFFALILPSLAVADPSASGSPVAGARTLQSTYPDPGAPGVFWIAPLLQGPLADGGPENYRALLNLEQA